MTQGDDVSEEAVETGLERVTQLWPGDLKKRVQDKVGKRGVTRFTLEAIREKFAREDAATVLAEAIDEPIEAIAPIVEEPVITIQPVPELETIAERPVPVRSQLIGGETRGDDVAVEPVASAASQEYSSSRARVEAMLAKAGEMGLTKAADLPVPPPKPVAEIDEPDQIEGESQRGDRHSAMEPIPDDQPTLQEELAALPKPVQTPVYNLKDIEVDF